MFCTSERKNRKKERKRSVATQKRERRRGRLGLDSPSLQVDREKPKMLLDPRCYSSDSKEKVPTV